MSTYVLRERYINLNRSLRFQAVVLHVANQSHDREPGEFLQVGRSQLVGTAHAKLSSHWVLITEISPREFVTDQRNREAGIVVGFEELAALKYGNLHGC